MIFFMRCQQSDLQILIKIDQECAEFEDASQLSSLCYSLSLHL